jgi:hypothetical protein
MKWLERLIDRSPCPASRRAEAGAQQYVSPRLPREPEVFPQEALVSPSPTSSATTTTAATQRPGAERVTDGAERDNARSRPQIEPLPTASLGRSERQDTSARLPGSDSLASELASPSALEPEWRPPSTTIPQTAQLEPAPANRAKATLGPASVHGESEASPIRLEPTPMRASPAPQPASDTSERAAEAARQLASALEAARSAATEAIAPKAPVAEDRVSASRSADQLRPAPAPVLERPTAGPRLSIGRLVVEVTTPAPVVVKRAPLRPRAAPARKLAAPPLSTLRFGLGVK